MTRATRGWTLAGLLAAGLALQATATEGGGGAYPNGSEGFMTGALPPLGQYFINYMAYYSADSFKGGDGHTDPTKPNFELHAVAEVLRFVNVTPITVLGGNWAQHVLVPIEWEEARWTPGPKDKNFGLGDIVVDPFIVGWHKPPFHWLVGLDTYVPVGKYHAVSFANLGRNYWTFEPLLGVTYLNEGGQELSAKMMYDFNTPNTDSATPGVSTYTSGQEFHTDFVVAQHCGNWAIGVGGYWYYQTTDDKRDGVRTDGTCGRALALGPQISYQCCQVNFSLEIDHELAAKNKPQGDKYWLKAVVPL